MNEVSVNIPSDGRIRASINPVRSVQAEVSKPTGASTSDYNSLKNRPLINHVLLEGDLSLEDLGINNEVATAEETKAYLGIAI